MATESTEGHGKIKPAKQSLCYTHIQYSDITFHVSPFTSHVSPLLLARENQIVAMDDFGFIDVAKQFLDAAAGLPGNPA